MNLLCTRKAERTDAAASRRTTPCHPSTRSRRRGSGLAAGRTVPLTPHSSSLGEEPTRKLLYRPTIHAIRSCSSRKLHGRLGTKTRGPSPSIKQNRTRRVSRRILSTPPSATIQIRVSRTARRAADACLYRRTATDTIPRQTGKIRLPRVCVMLDALPGPPTTALQTVPSERHPHAAQRPGAIPTQSLLS